MKILIVDDSSVMRRIIKNYLSQLGYNDFIEAQDGIDALDKVKDTDLIFTDWNMPNMNGFEFLKKVRAIPEHKNTKIIMVTTESSKFDVIDAIKAGVTEYIIKPFTLQSFEEKLKKALAK